MKAVALVLALAACSGKLPDTRYYQLAAPESGKRDAVADLTLVLEPLATEAAYDDERIVYRTTPYRLDYYQYHRWSAAPGVMIGNFLETALEKSGRFRNVVRELGNGDAAPVVLGGRVVAIEEVDRSPRAWYGRLAIELTLTDARTGATLWSEQFDETEAMATQTPEGLARALSIAMTRISRRAAPTIADLAERQARVHAEQNNVARGAK
ncbi:MAG TPA: ABC-type transport auxiliary lipoprotein family protein [Kofleriaceae bacterium]|nr:ABC-type transport auxiliary lipoprotein family protein [Kofleriaceae bacterium]